MSLWAQVSITTFSTLDYPSVQLDTSVVHLTPICPLLFLLVLCMRGSVSSALQDAGAKSMPAAAYHTPSTHFSKNRTKRNYYTVAHRDLCKMHGVTEISLQTATVLFFVIQKIIIQRFHLNWFLITTKWYLSPINLFNTNISTVDCLDNLLFLLTITKTTIQCRTCAWRFTSRMLQINATDNKENNWISKSNQGYFLPAWQKRGLDYYHHRHCN